MQKSIYKLCVHCGKRIKWESEDEQAKQMMNPNPWNPGSSGREYSSTSGNRVPFLTCPHCPYTFRREEDLNRHLEEQNATWMKREIKTKTIKSEDMHDIMFSELRCNGEASEADVSCTSEQNTGTLGTQIQLTTKSVAKANHCEKYGLSFPPRQHLRKPVKCDLCDKTFASKQNLTVHLRIHNGEKPFKCDQCDKAFAQKGNLTAHLKIHPHDKSFTCD